MNHCGPCYSESSSGSCQRREECTPARQCHADGVTCHCEYVQPTQTQILSFSQLPASGGSPSAMHVKVTCILTLILGRLHLVQLLTLHLALYGLEQSPQQDASYAAIVGCGPLAPIAYPLHLSCFVLGHCILKGVGYAQRQLKGFPATSNMQAVRRDSSCRGSYIKSTCCMKLTGGRIIPGCTAASMCSRQ